MFICFPRGIQDVGDFVSSVEHKQRFLTQTVAVCHIMTVNGFQSFESKKTHTLYILLYISMCQSMLRVTRRLF